MIDVEEPLKDEVVVESKEREVRLDPSQALEWGDIAVAGHPKEAVVEEEIQPEEVIEVEEEEVPFIPTSLPTDPGDYTPADYSFEVEIEGKKTKIESVGQAETFMDENADKFTAPELMKILRQTQKMEIKLESDKLAYDNKKQEFDESKEILDEQRQTASNISAEIAYMVSKGMIPAITDPEAAKRWATDPTAYLDKEFLKTSGVKEQVDLITALEKENKMREEAGLQPTKSILDVYNSLQLTTKTQEELDEKTQRAQARKQASSRVSGNSPSPVNIAPKGIAVGRTLALDSLDSF